MRRFGVLTCISTLYPPFARVSNSNPHLTQPGLWVGSKVFRVVRARKTTLTWSKRTNQSFTSTLQAYNLVWLCSKMFVRVEKKKTSYTDHPFREYAKWMRDQVERESRGVGGRERERVEKNREEEKGGREREKGGGCVSLLSLR